MKSNRVLLLLATLALHACSILPAPQIEAETLQAANTQSQSLEMLEYQAQVKELLSMREQINRLVELESDLSFLLDEMGRFEEQNPDLTFAENNTDVSEDLSENKAVMFSESGSTNQSRESDTALQKAEVGVAKELMSLVNEGAEDNKFSNPPENQAVFETADDSKFRQSSLGNKQNAANNSRRESNQNLKQVSGVTKGVCDSSNMPSLSARFAVHLASYSSQASALKGIDELRKKHATRLCAAVAKSHQVEVKGKNYFSIRFGGYNTQGEANEVCKAIRTTGDYCKVTDFVGEVI